MNNILYTIISAIAFLIPGFITTYIIRRVIPKVDKDYKTSVLENFIYSFLNIFLWAIPIYKIYINIGWWNKKILLLWLVCLLIIFVSPIIIASVIIIFYQKEVFRELCQYFNISSIDTEPSAWDFKFKKIENEWVIITLKDKTTIGGYIGVNSFISSNCKERDLYIDEQYEISKNGEWKKVNRTDGIWIKNDEIKYIEFLKDERKNKNGKNNQ